MITRAEYCWSQHRTFDDDKIPEDTITTYEKLQSHRIQFKSNKLDQMTKKAVAKLQIPKNFAIYLPPLSDDQSFVPLLTFELDSEKASVANFRLDLYHYDKVLNLHHVGFRFETPTQGSKKHLFFHAQPIEHSSQHVIPGSNSGAKRTGTLPCLPLQADDPVSLVICLVLSLYGLEGCVKVLDEASIQSGFRRQVEFSIAGGDSWRKKGW